MDDWGVKPHATFFFVMTPQKDTIPHDVLICLMTGLGTLGDINHFSLVSFGSWVGYLCFLEGLHKI